MSQRFAVELYFDPALENQVLKAWNVLARRQISTQLIEIKSRPHLTLFTSSLVDIDKLENVLRTFAAKQEPLVVCFSSIGSLSSDDNVLFLVPAPTMSLLQFHSQLCDAMKKEGIEITEEQRPDSWIPYCSVAEEVPKARMAEAFTVLRDLKLPVSGHITDISLVEYPHIREVFSWTLGTHQISEATLDVFTVEPPTKDNKLVQQRNVIVTPHLGGNTKEAHEAISVDVAEAVRSALKGKRSASSVN